MSFYFGEKTWPELKEYLEKDAVILLPVGELEEHSLYLPVDTDTRIAKYFCDQIAEEVQDDIPILVLPPVWSGYTPDFVGQWPGAMRLHPQVFIDMVHGICSSIADMGFTHLVMVDCHGQHGPMLNIVTKLIADEYGYYYTVTSPLTFSAKEFNEVRKSPRGGVSHSGEWEASMVMKISPELVHPDKFTDVDLQRYQTEFVSGDTALGGQKVVWSSWGIQKITNGALGDPTEASVETADVIVAAVRKNYHKFLDQYYHFKKEE
ncbi:MAG: creatininase family protein [Clostridiales bacterium]|nr:creatininase family protein [Clostridiales bacterium]